MFSLLLLLEQLYSVVRLSLCVQCCHPRADIFWLNGPTTAGEFCFGFLAVHREEFVSPRHHGWMLSRAEREVSRE